MGSPAASATATGNGRSVTPRRPDGRGGLQTRCVTGTRSRRFPVGRLRPDRTLPASARSASTSSVRRMPLTPTTVSGTANSGLRSWASTTKSAMDGWPTALAVGDSNRYHSEHAVALMSLRRTGAHPFLLKAAYAIEDPRFRPHQDRLKQEAPRRACVERTLFGHRVLTAAKP